MENKKREIKVRPMSLTIKAVIVNSKNEILLLRRNSDLRHNPGKWDLPGGHIDENETVKEALLREIKEEAGIEVKMGPVVKISEFPKNHEAFKEEKRSIRFLAFYEGTGDEIKIEKREHSEYVWVDIDRAGEVLSPKDQYECDKLETIEEAKKYLEMVQSLDGWKRCLADLENYKKRVQKSNDEFRKYCLEDFVLELLPVMDHFEIATGNIPYEKTKEPWVTGVMHIKEQLSNVLQNRGISEIEVKEGDEIDASIHEVISGKGDKVKKVLKKGFRIGDRVVRAAVVEAGS